MHGAWELNCGCVLASAISPAFSSVYICQLHVCIHTLYHQFPFVDCIFEVIELTIFFQLEQYFPVDSVTNSQKLKKENSKEWPQTNSEPRVSHFNVFNLNTSTSEHEIQIHNKCSLTQEDHHSDVRTRVLRVITVYWSEPRNPQVICRQSYAVTSLKHGDSPVTRVKPTISQRNAKIGCWGVGGRDSQPSRSQERLADVWRGH